MALPSVGLRVVALLACHMLRCFQGACEARFRYRSRSPCRLYKPTPCIDNCFNLTANYILSPMPKRKAITSLSGLAGSDDEDVMQTGADHAQNHDERPTKRTRGRPRSKSAEIKPIAETAAPKPQATEPVTRRGTRRGRPKGSRNSGQMAQNATEDQETSARVDNDAVPQKATGDDETEAPENTAQTSKSTRTTKGAPARGRRKASVQKEVETDGEFQYTPTGGRQQKAAVKTEKSEKKPEPTGRRRPKSVTAPSEDIPEAEPAVQEIVEETIIQEEAPEPGSVSPTKRRQSSLRTSQGSPLKRISEVENEKAGSEPELRRRLGDLTKKHDTLENRYRNLRDIGIVEANANMEKLKKQCERMTTGMLSQCFRFSLAYTKTHSQPRTT